MKYRIIKKGTESPEYFIEIEGNHGMCFGYVGGYRGYDFRDSLEECQKDLEKLMQEDKLENEKWDKENHREVVFEKEIERNRMKYTKIEDAIERLEEIANLEGTELGESWDGLIRLHSYSYCFSRDFNIALINEIFKQAEESHESFEIVEEKSEFIEKHLRIKNNE